VAVQVSVRSMSSVTEVDPGSTISSINSHQGMEATTSKKAVVEEADHPGSARLMKMVSLIPGLIKHNSSSSSRVETTTKGGPPTLTILKEYHPGTTIGTGTTFGTRKFLTPMACV